MYRQEQNNGNGCWYVILTVILIALAPFILEVLGFIAFMLFAMLASAFH